MKPRDSALRLKRFEATEKARKVASLETMILDLEHMAADLARQIAAEEERTGIRDPAHFAYSTFAKAAAQRRANLLTSVADLRVKLDGARREHEEAALELSKLEPVESRDTDRQHGKADQQRRDDRLTQSPRGVGLGGRTRLSSHIQLACRRLARAIAALTAVPCRCGNSLATRGLHQRLPRRLCDHATAAGPPACPLIEVHGCDAPSTCQRPRNRYGPDLGCRRRRLLAVRPAVAAFGAAAGHPVVHYPDAPRDRRRRRSSHARPRGRRRSPPARRPTSIRRSPAARCAAGSAPTARSRQPTSSTPRPRRPPRAAPPRSSCTSAMPTSRDQRGTRASASRSSAAAAGVARRHHRRSRSRPPLSRADGARTWRRGRRAAAAASARPHAACAALPAPARPSTAKSKATQNTRR